MLRLWREQVRIFLHPRQIVLLRLSRGLKQRVTHKQVLPCVEAIGIPVWQAPIAALKSALQDAHWLGASTQVVLSNHFVRYALIPWSGQITDSRECQAYLRHCFGMVYGEAAKRWDLRMNTPHSNAPSLASGIDTALLESLCGTLDGAGIRTETIHPYLMIGANRSRRWIPPGAAWFVMVEHGRLCLSLLDCGVWKIIRNYPVEFNRVEQFEFELETLLARESVLSGDVQQDWPVVLYWPESAMTLMLPGRQVTRVHPPALTGITASDDQAYRLAMWT